MIQVAGAAILAVAAISGAECPFEPPRDAVSLSVECGRTGVCPNQPAVLRLEPLPSGFFPPAPFDPGYMIQPCDTVTWSFGDGTGTSAVGTPQVTHHFVEPGNYDIRVTIANAMGHVSTLLADDYPVADAPSRVDFVTDSPPSSPCSKCVSAREDDGSVDIVVKRTLDTARRVSVEAIVWGRIRAEDPIVRQTLTFAPGETEKVFHVPLIDDDVYYGPRWLPLHFAAPIGGLIADNSVDTRLFVSEDEPRPVCSIGAGVAVTEGNSGRTMFSVPVTLSAPLASDLMVDVFYVHGSATEDDFVRGGSLIVRAGETSGAVTGWIAGDRLVESDETFIVRLFPRNATGDPAFDVRDATVTILNDDVAAAPASPSIPTLDVFTCVVLIVLMAAAGAKVVKP